MTTWGKHLALVLLIFFGLEMGPAAADEMLVAAGERLGKTCAGCHGTDGASPGKLIPIIGGQKPGYIAKVLGEFAAEKRPGTAMLKLAKGFSAEEHKQIAAFFASKPWVNTPHAAASGGDAELVKRCQGCHGKNGEGRGSFPRLAGQHPEYLFQALMEYKQGERTAGTMKLVKGSDEATLKKMADYYASLK